MCVDELCTLLTRKVILQTHNEGSQGEGQKSPLAFRNREWINCNTYSLLTTEDKGGNIGTWFCYQTSNCIWNSLPETKLLVVDGVPEAESYGHTPPIPSLWADNGVKKQPLIKQGKTQLWVWLSVYPVTITVLFSKGVKKEREKGQSLCCQGKALRRTIWPHPHLNSIGHEWPRYLHELKGREPKRPVTGCVFI